MKNRLFDKSGQPLFGTAGGVPAARGKKGSWKWQPSEPCEYKVVALRECPTPKELQICDTPEMAADYWRLHVETSPYFNLECECMVALMLNARRRVKGHYLVSIGSVDSLLFHPRELFRTAIVSAASSILMMHNHPSGEPEPSMADIEATREAVQAGRLIKIEVVDHIIMGSGRYASMRGLSCFDGWFGCGKAGAK